MDASRHYEANQLELQLNGRCIDVFKLLTALHLHLHSNRATKTSDAIIRLCTIVVHEHSAVPEIAKEGAAKFSYSIRCFQPA